MVLYLAAFVATMPEVFEGMLKIRIGYVSFLITDVSIKAVSTLQRKRRFHSENASIVFRVLFKTL